jgi:hypothetical protein
MDFRILFTVIIDFTFSEYSKFDQWIKKFFENTLVYLKSIFYQIKLKKNYSVDKKKKEKHT